MYTKQIYLRNVSLKADFFQIYNTIIAVRIKNSPKTLPTSEYHKNNKNHNAQ
jgi:hypothetical protein